MKGIGLRKVSLFSTEICNKISAFCLANNYFQHTANLKTFSSFVFDLLNKILLGALGIWLSISTLFSIPLDRSKAILLLWF